MSLLFGRSPFRLQKVDNVALNAVGPLKRECNVKMVYPMSGGITVACQCFLHDLLCLWLFTTFGMLFL